MGSFDVGNFDNDDALDVTNDFIEQITASIRENLADEHFGVEDCDRVMAYIVILNAILQQTRCSGVTPEDHELLVILKNMGDGAGLSERQVRGWKENVLKVFDAEIDGLQPTPEYKSGRRKAMQDAFNALESFIKSDGS